MNPKQINEVAARQERRVQNILNENRSWKVKYADLLEHLDSGNAKLRARVMSTLQVMENQARYVESLASDPRMEATFTQNLGALVPKVVDLVRIFYPNMVTHDLVDVQTIDRQNGEIFVVQPVYSNTGAGVNAGDQVFKTVTDGTYASEQTSLPLVNGGSNTVYTGSLPRTPVRPGTVAITRRTSAGVIQSVVADNGTGQFAGSGITGTINYANGAISVTYSPANGASDVVTAVGRYDSEQSTNNIRKLSINLGTIPIQAESHPLLVDWSVQAQLAAAAHLDLDVPQTLADTVASFIKQERDVSLINNILSIAVTDTALNFDATAPTNFSRLARYAEIELKLNYAESLIQYGQGRGGVSWILCGTNAADIWRNCNGFEPSDVVAPIGPHKIGTLRDGAVAIIKNPFMNKDTYVIGFKGYVMGDAATILAEWIPLYATPVFQAPELVNSQGMTSLYALFNNPMTAAAYYKKGTVTNYGA